ncbi:helix-turn-helix domain-containing protein, partial [Streptomyces sp. NPDC059411]|uniref:helix-turn-helix domain-containing protein n=1 Tax=Streptomyces sp. NPDC059411 TaxID=3346825 RepID=UPI00368CBE4D
MGDALGDPADDTAVPFPAQLRRLRVERGLSLADLARRTHYSKGYLSKIETGVKPVTAEVARSCDRVLGAEGELLRLVPESEGPVGPGAAASPSGPPSDGVCPYRGLAAFTPRDEEWFFGRERATAALVERAYERLGHGPLLLLARSGVGKSSLLNAGLVPALGRGAFPVAGADGWPVVRFTPTAHPLRELLDATAEAVGGDTGVTPETLRARPELLLEAVHRLSDGSGAVAGAGPGAGARHLPTVRPVLIVDQFEELFTLCVDEDERHAFVGVLCAVAGSRPSVTGYDPALVVLGVRADFSASCLELPGLAAVFTDGLFVLPPMSVAELRESITRPAELAGLTLEPGLVPLLLRDAGDAPSGALPLMSQALMATWRRREGSTLTVAGYEHAGGIQGVVAQRAEQVFAGLYPAEQRTIRRLLVRLVHIADGAGPTRRRAGRAALLEQDGTGRTAAALDAFVRAQLITADSDTVEITHEALLHAWPRLRDWIHADRAGLLVHQQLAQAAEDWVRVGRVPG